MKISASHHPGGFGLLDVVGELDAFTSEDLASALKEWIAKEAGRVILNFTEVTFLSSAGLRVLQKAQKDSRAIGGEVRVFGVSGHVAKVFAIVGFDRLIPIFPTLQEALHDWASPKGTNPA